jgi:UDP-N-acetylglucosamine 2-epimerase
MSAKVLSIIGTRPQYVKLAAIKEAFDDVGFQHTYIDTGQHYSDTLSENIRSGLGLPPALYNLNIGAGSQIYQISKIMNSLEEIIPTINPGTVVVYGDTNSTLAATLLCTRLGIHVRHVEAGLRSGDFAMPEEQNRIVVDHLCKGLYAPTERALRNLSVEGLATKSMFTGDVMFDVLKKYLSERNNSNVFKQNDSKEEFLVATFHRPANVDNCLWLSELATSLRQISYQIKLYTHPRLLENLKKCGISMPPNVILKEPVNHAEMVHQMINCKAVITDSGGIQKEAFILQTPCTTLRDTTEWEETLEQNWNILVPNVRELVSKVNLYKPKEQSQPFGDGTAANKIVNNILKSL